MTLMQALANVLQSGESLTIQLKKETTGFALIVMPVLHVEPDDMPESLAAVRAALCAPLLIRGSVEELEGSMAQQVALFSALRTETADAYHGTRALLISATEIAQKARVAPRAALPAPSQGRKKVDVGDEVETGEADTPDKPATPASVALPAKNPDSLF